MTGSETILGAEIYNWLLAYGYPIFILISIVDSTYIGFFAGVLSSLGVFNPFIIFGICVVVRVITDSIIFFLAKSGSSFLEKFSFYRKVIQKINKGNGYNDNEWTYLFKEHIVKTLLVAKMIPIPGFLEAVLIAGGALGASYKKALYGVFVGQTIWVGIIVSLGYYFGDAIKSSRHLLNVIGFIVVLTILLVLLYRKYAHEYVKTRPWYKNFIGNGDNGSKQKQKLNK